MHKSPVKHAQTAHVFIALFLLSLSAFLGATTTVAASPSGQILSTQEWLAQMNEAAMKRRTYIGTLMQSSREGMSSARIWHSCDGFAQIERIDSLTGSQRSSIRHNSQIATLIPEQKLVVQEKRDGFVAQGNFTELLKPGSQNSSQIDEHYSIRLLGSERVAGQEAEIVQIWPRDHLRFGYRLWTDKKTLLILKLQTLSSDGHVLEQSAFSEVQQAVPINTAKLKQMMKAPEGWKTEQVRMQKTDAKTEGWMLKTAVPGFQPTSCIKRSQDAGSMPRLQWVFSDGLATVSVFIDAINKAQPAKGAPEGIAVSGATSSLMQRQGDYFVSVVGEVPHNTLKLFAQSLQRKNP